MLRHRIGKFEISVSSDHRNYVLNRVLTVKDGDNAGNEVLSPVGYYNSLQAVGKRMAQLVGNQESGTLADWSAAHNRTLREFEEATKEFS